MKNSFIDTKSNSFFLLTLVFFVITLVVWSKLRIITRRIDRINSNIALHQGKYEFSFYQSEGIKQEIFNERLIEKFE